MPRVLVRSWLDAKWSLVLDVAQQSPLTAEDVCGPRGILGDRVPVIAWDDSGPDGALVFPGTPEGFRLAVLLRDQLNDVIQGAFKACPAESFPEPGAPDVDAADFAEPTGGESARVAAEEAAWEAQIRAEATATPAVDPADTERAAFHGWRSGDRFEVLNRDDVARAAAASYLWPAWWGGPSTGHVISRCDMHLAGHHTVPGLLVGGGGLHRPTVIAAETLSACARKVS